MNQPQRRSLAFHSFDEVLADLDQLESRGYDQLGKWNLGQVCRHLNDWMRFPMDGFPKQILPIRVMLYLMKIMFGKSQFQKILHSGSMKAGMPTMPETVHPTTPSDGEAVANFRQTVCRMRDYRGAIHPSPLFGDMDLASAQRLQLIHCSHHLSFLIPK